MTSKASKIKPNYFKHKMLNLGSLVNSHIDLLRKKRVITNKRAVLYTKNSLMGFRTALWLSFDKTENSPSIFSGFKGMWFLERTDHRVIILGSKNRLATDGVNGRVIHSPNILCANSLWVSELATNITSLVISQLKGYYDLQLVEFEQSLYSVEFELIKLAVQSFIYELDHQVIDILKTERAADNSVYNYYLSTSGEQNTYKVQATQSYPWFSTELRHNWTLNKTIDRGASLLSELARRYKVKPSTIKYLNRSEFYDDVNFSKENIITLVDQFNANYWPKNRNDSLIFLHLAPTLIDLSNTLQISINSLAKPFNQGWNQGLGRLEKSLGRTLNLNSIFTMMQASYSYGIRPMFDTKDNSKLSTIPPVSWQAKWFSHYGLKRLLQMATKWELSFGEFSLNRLDVKNKNSGNSELKWMALLPQITNQSLDSTVSYGHFRIVELISQHDLNSESYQLDHCASTYAARNLILGSYVFSIRDYTGKSLSTFEINFNPSVNQSVEVILVQHSGKRNIRPKHEESEVVQWFMRTVLTNVKQTHINTVEQSRLKLAMVFKGDLANMILDEKPLVENELEKLQEMVAFTHPKSMNKKDIIKYFTESFS